MNACAAGIAHVGLPMDEAGLVRRPAPVSEDSSLLGCNDWPLRTKESLICWSYREKRTRVSSSMMILRLSWSKFVATRSAWASKPQRKYLYIATKFTRPFAAASSKGKKQTPATLPNNSLLQISDKINPLTIGPISRHSTRNSGLGFLRISRPKSPSYWRRFNDPT